MVPLLPYRRSMERLASAMLLGTLLLTGAAAVAQPITDSERDEIEGVIRDYLLREPEILVEAIAALEERRIAEAVDQQREAIREASGDLLATPVGTALGNPDGDVTLVEFFDYNCGYCQRAQPDIQALIAADPELRVVLKEIPVLGEESVAASRVSLAVREVAPDRYAEFHSALLLNGATADEAVALEVAEDLGIEAGPLREAIDGPAVAATLQENARLAALLTITGTPSYVIGDEMIAGAVGVEPLAQRIENVRECGAATC